MFPSPTKSFHNDSYAAIKPTRAELSTKGKNILITGGGAGIGRHIAEGFAQSGAATIALVGRSESVLTSAQRELSAAYPATKTYAYAADIVDAASISAAFSKFASDVDGKIDVLVSNAGYGPDWKTIEEADPDDWWSSFAVNVRGAFNVIRAFLTVAAEDATALNVTSGATGLPYVPNASAYASAKLSVVKMWEYLGQEHPKFTTISFHPGVIEGTVMSNKSIEQGVNMPADAPALPMGFAVWLASPEAKFLKGKLVWSGWDVDELKANAAQIQNSMMFSVGQKGFPDMVPFEN